MCFGRKFEPKYDKCEKVAKSILSKQGNSRENYINRLLKKENGCRELDFARSWLVAKKKSHANMIPGHEEILRTAAKGCVDREQLDAIFSKLQAEKGSESAQLLMSYQLTSLPETQRDYRKLIIKKAEALDCHYQAHRNCAHAIMSLNEKLASKDATANHAIPRGNSDIELARP